MTGAAPVTDGDETTLGYVEPPELYCPFPSRINPHTAEAHQRTLAWGDRFGLLGTGRARQHQAGERHTWLTGRIFPNASRERLQLLCDWTSWLFWHDDVCDETVLGEEPKRLSLQFEQLFRILTGASPPRSTNAFDMALMEMVARFNTLAVDRAWFHRFVVDVQEYFQACIWEAYNRLYHKTPRLGDFIPMRRCAGGTWMYLTFLEFANDQVLPIELRKHTAVQRLMEITCDVACWHNDIYSWPKELRRGDVHNLVAVLKADLGLSLDGAVAEAAQCCDREVRAFSTIQSNMPKFRPSIAVALENYVTGLQSIIRGNLDWARESERYKCHSVYGSDRPLLPDAVIAQAEASDIVV